MYVSNLDREITFLGKETIYYLQSHLAVIIGDSVHDHVLYN